MSMYENILDILEKKGPTTIPVICQEMNMLPNNPWYKERPVQPEQIKSTILRKNDLFKLEDEMVYIDPNREVRLLVVHVGGNSGTSITIKVDFLKSQFHIFEWLYDSTKCFDTIPKEFTTGNLEEFKKDLYRICVWEWEADYHGDGIILDGLIWTVKLVTKGKTYESKGMHYFPKSWPKLSKSLSKLIGLKLS